MVFHPQQGIIVILSKESPPQLKHCQWCSAGENSSYGFHTNQSGQIDRGMNTATYFGLLQT